MNGRLLQRSRFLLLSILEWAGSLGLFALIRETGAESTLNWIPNRTAYISLWVLASVLFGATFWLITLVAESHALRSKPYGLLILSKSLAMLATVLCFVAIRGMVALVSGDLTLQRSLEDGVALLRTPAMVVFLVYVWVNAVAFGFIRQISAMAGPKVLVNLLLGKYHRPKVETRIFMFLDLEGSTTIAEKLGHEQFCRLIQECFRDLTDSAIRRQVEVYQYVGDEAILTWTPSRGLEDCNCVRLFFEFDDAIKQREQFYAAEFGLRPTFKAGANLGEATVAEVGVVKREIAYLSDVLNTAARLEAMCREHDARLLVTSALYEALPIINDLNGQSIGKLEIRGKSQHISVFRIDRI
jgi:adenylate cyclase